MHAFDFSLLSTVVDNGNDIQYDRFRFSTNLYSFIAVSVFPIEVSSNEISCVLLCFALCCTTHSFSCVSYSLVFYFSLSLSRMFNFLFNFPNEIKFQVKMLKIKIIKKKIIDYHHHQQLNCNKSIPAKKINWKDTELKLWRSEHESTRTVHSEILSIEFYSLGFQFFSAKRHFPC